LNPAQEKGASFSAQITTANKSFYAWDQTIVFQTVDASIGIGRNSLTNGLQCIGTAASSFAVIQYLPAAQAREILSQHNAIQLQGAITTGTLNGAVSMYWTTDASLPDIKTPTFNSLVSSITAGVPATTNGTWNKVARDTLANPATFTLTTTNQSFDFVGFDDTASAGKTSATFFAIVIAFDTLAIGSTVTIDYCSLVGGDIATRPAPQTSDEVLRECQFYYETSYDIGVVPGSASFESCILSPQTAANGSVNVQEMYAKSFPLSFKTVKRKTPTYSTTPSLSLLKFYSPDTGTLGNVRAVIYSGTSRIYNADAVFTTYWANFHTGTKNFTFNSGGNSAISATSLGWPTNVESYITYHFTADARLGVLP
jgi:hypothetical protein